MRPAVPVRLFALIAAAAALRLQAPMRKLQRRPLGFENSPRAAERRSLVAPLRAQEASAERPSRVRRLVSLVKRLFGRAEDQAPARQPLGKKKAQKSDDVLDSFVNDAALQRPDWAVDKVVTEPTYNFKSYADDVDGPRAPRDEMASAEDVATLEALFGLK